MHSFATESSICSFLHLRITFYVNLQPSPRIMEWLGSVQVNSNGKTWAAFTVEHLLLIIDGTLWWKIRGLLFNQLYLFRSCRHMLHYRRSLLFNSDSHPVRSSKTKSVRESLVRWDMFSSQWRPSIGYTLITETLLPKNEKHIYHLTTFLYHFQLIWAHLCLP